jgi:hypothetical protein
MNEGEDLIALKRGDSGYDRIAIPFLKQGPDGARRVSKS